MDETIRSRSSLRCAWSTGGSDKGLPLSRPTSTPSRGSPETSPATATKALALLCRRGPWGEIEHRHRRSPARPDTPRHRAPMATSAKPPIGHSDLKSATPAGPSLTFSVRTRRERRDDGRRSRLVGSATKPSAGCEVEHIGSVRQLDGHRGDPVPVAVVVEINGETSEPVVVGEGILLRTLAGDADICG